VLANFVDFRVMDRCPDFCWKLTDPTESWLRIKVCTADIAKKATLRNAKTHYTDRKKIANFKFYILIGT
jgi:hypothetical protein